MTRWHMFLMTALAMVAFAANSVLNRLALADGTIDALAYSGLRPGSRGNCLMGQSLPCAAPRGRVQGWVALGAAQPPWLLTQSAFRWRMWQLDAGLGALVLFTSVQIGILLWARVKGERPGRLEMAGFALALLALALLFAARGPSAPLPPRVLWR